MVVTQIGDPAASDLAYRGERLGHPLAEQRGVDPVTDPPQWCAVMRRA